MLIIPEIQTVVILVPKNASSSIIAAVREEYQNSFLLYRHMEADGVPFGYNTWRKIGVVRNPVDRLWSLYKYIKRMDGFYVEGYIKTIKKSVDTPFNDWIVNNTTSFSNPFDPTNNNYYNPKYTVNYLLPETRKSQFISLRPDLGTIIYDFDDLDDLGSDLGIRLEKRNACSNCDNMPPLTPEAQRHINQYFKWDLDECQSVR